MTGTVALAMGIVEYYATPRMLRRSYRFRLARPTLVMSVVLTFAGGLLCIGIVSRLL
jgi:hypothetical protein